MIKLHNIQEILQKMINTQNNKIYEMYILINKP